MINKIENWWRHNGIFDRVQASGIPYESKRTQNYLRKTDEWWESKTDDEKVEIYNEFFSED